MLSNLVGLDVDVLANMIRTIDGRHDMGAGALAEALVPKLAALAPVEAEAVAWWVLDTPGADFDFSFFRTEAEALDTLEVDDPTRPYPLYTHPTPPAARELLEDVLGNLLGEEAIVWVETTTDGKYAEKMHALCNKARQSIATLTQQQGGEQEALPEPTHLGGLYSVEVVEAVQQAAWRLGYNAALRTKQPAASGGDGRTFDRGVRAAQDVVRALCCHYQEEMKYPDCSISYLSDLEEVTQGLFWEIDKLLDKTCRVPPKGWHCTRGKDHEGPCAVVRNEEVAPPGTSGSSFWIEEKALEVAQEISQMKSPHRAQLVAGIRLAVTKAMLWAVGGAKE